MRIVIDLQGAQSSGSRNRGIGRYTLSLAQSIVRNKGSHEVFIALNGLFADTIEPIRVLFDQLLPQENIRVWHAVSPVCHIDKKNNWRRRTAEFTREAFLATLCPDILYVTSLFEGLTDDAVTSIGLFTQNIPTAVTLYDLIPLINRSPYLDNPEVESWYENKLDQIRRSGLLLAISESSRQEGIDYLGFPAERSVNVGTAADPQFTLTDITDTVERDIRKRYGINKSFLMYTGGIDHRKNIEGLIRSYALLPLSVRINHQLAIVCAVNNDTRKILADLALKQGLAAEEVILTGFVTENDLISLYHLCTAFIFPSWHEGFGLPALEAMSCGAAVIAANTSSLPEVVGKIDALFNPHDDIAISEKIQQVLTDDVYRKELIQHGLEQAKKFSWDASAKLAISAFEKFHAENLQTKLHLSKPAHRPKLAYISPLPPERTGIADYSSELLPELARYYDIDVIVEQETVTGAWIKENCSVRTALWFSSHSQLYDRILYHFGNSPYHQHMFDLLNRIPGVVVLHDFFLGHVTTHMDGIGGHDYADFLAKTLYHSHGYNAVNERFHNDNIWNLAWKYPCNKTVLNNARAVIVHSENSKKLAHQWYGHSITDNWSVIPHLRCPAPKLDRLQARKELGLNSDAFVVSSFGLLGQSKQNQRLLEAWIASPLSSDERSLLIFVGENDGGDYGTELANTIYNSGLAHKIHITGWASNLQFRQYLAVTDIAVQLRTLSRGETSGTVLDCMNYGLAIIANANGSMADLPADAVCLLPDKFEITDLSIALENLWKDKTYRDQLGQQARSVIDTLHKPRACADQYFQVIEKYSNCTNIGVDTTLLTQAISKIDPAPSDEWEFLLTAKSIAKNQGLNHSKQLFLDISILVQCDAKSGIQRVVRSILSELLKNPPSDFNVEPIYAIPGKVGYYYARKFTLRFLNCPDNFLDDQPVDTFSGDIFLGLDLVQYAAEQQIDFYTHLRQIGGYVYFVIYDLLPILDPNKFPDGIAAAHEKWLASLAQFDGVIGISRAVADEVIEWLDVFAPKRLQPLKIGYFHLGADVAESIPTIGFLDNAENVIKALTNCPTFLMVGTIEPRKGQKQALAAFELLWAQGIEINLVLVGKRGWGMESFIEKICDHSENNKRLFWLEGASDQYLEKIYASSSCLVAASEGEGFGLPLVEAAQHKVPIIARDIPVFREVAGSHALYFSGLDPNALAYSVQAWLALHEKGAVPQSINLPWLTWKQSTRNLLDVILDDQWLHQWIQDDVHRFSGSDSRLRTAMGIRTGRNMATTFQSGHLIFGPFLPLEAGEYQVMVRGSVGKGGLSGARMDAACSGGTLVLGECELGERDNNGYLGTLFISLAVSCADFEVRIWVSDQTDLQISMLEIRSCKFDGVNRFAGSDSRFSTLIGTRSGREIRSTRQAGYLLFGPYIPLAVGQYLVVICGTLGSNGLAGALVDIVIDKGEFVIAESALCEPDNDGCLIALAISLDAPCTDLEIRVWVTEKTDLNVSMIEIRPWQDRQKTMNTNSEVSNPSMSNKLMRLPPKKKLFLITNTLSAN